MTLTDNTRMLQQIAEAIAENVPEVDLILLYGSFARGLGHELSDYDLIIICDAKKVAWEFILNERPVLAWSMTWKFAEEIVTGEKGFWSTSAGSLVDGIILWEKNDKIRKKFEEIISKASIGSNRVVESVIQHFDSFYGKLWQIEKSIKDNKLENVRLLIWDLANAICHALAGLNNQYYQNNWGKQLSEIENFIIKPDNFKERYIRLVTSEPVKSLKIAEKLTEDIHELLIDWLDKKKPKPDKSFEEIITNWTAAIESLYSIKASAKRNNLTAGIYAVTDFIEFIFWLYMVLSEKRWDRNSFYPIDRYLRELPDTIRKNVEILLFSTQLEELALSTEKITQDLRKQLLTRGALLPEVKSLKEGLQFLRIWDIKMLKS